VQRQQARRGGEPQVRDHARAEHDARCHAHEFVLRQPVESERHHEQQHPAVHLQEALARADAQCDMHHGCNRSPGIQPGAPLAEGQWNAAGRGCVRGQLPAHQAKQCRQPVAHDISPWLWLARRSAAAVSVPW
jgi:hypothetical protein